MTPLGIKPATLRLVAHCLNQLRHRVPAADKITLFSISITLLLYFLHLFVLNGKNTTFLQCALFPFPGEGFGKNRLRFIYNQSYLGPVAYPGIFFEGVQQIQLRTETIENGDLWAVAP